MKGYLSITIPENAEADDEVFVEIDFEPGEEGIVEVKILYGPQWGSHAGEVRTSAYLDPNGVIQQEPIRSWWTTWKDGEKVSEWRDGMNKTPAGMSLMEECQANVQAELEARNEVIEASNCAWDAFDYVIADLKAADPEDGHAQSLTDLRDALNLWARCVNVLNPQGGYPEAPEPVDARGNECPECGNPCEEFCGPCSQAAGEFEEMAYGPRD